MRSPTPTESAFSDGRPRDAFPNGHRYEHKFSPLEVRTKYWSFREFPGTWNTAAQYSYQHVGMTQWLFSPQESRAEAFKVGMLGGGGEKTWDYGRTINAVTIRAFLPAAVARALISDPERVLDLPR